MWLLLLPLLPCLLALPLVFCSKDAEPTRDKKTLSGPPKTLRRDLAVADSSDAPSVLGSVQEPPRSEDTVAQSVMKSVSMSGQRPKKSSQRPMSDGSSMASVQSSAKSMDSTHLSVLQDSNQTDSSYFQPREQPEPSASVESN